MTRPVTPATAAENLDLVDRVLADCRIKHEKHGVWRARIGFFHDTDDFFELGHELDPVLQPSRGIHQDHIGAQVRRHLDRVESERRGIAALFALNDRTAKALSPNAQLLDRGGAERISSGEQHAVTLA